MKKKGNKKIVMKLVALFVIVAIVFVIWKDPISSKANSHNEELSTKVQEQSKENYVKNFVIQMEDSSYAEYTITDETVTCVYFEYIGMERGEAKYEQKTSTVDIASVEETSSIVSRGGSEGPLYWKKKVNDKLKRDYFYQSGVKGADVYYKIGWEEQPYIINYTKLANTRDVDAYINLLDDVNKQIITCLAVAIGAVMVAIAAIISSYIAIGAKDCLTAVSGILNKCGVKLIQLSPISFGHMVFRLYDDYVELEKRFALAATYGVPASI